MKKILLIHPEGNINNNPNLTGIVEILCEGGHAVDIVSPRRTGMSQTSPCAGAAMKLIEAPDPDHAGKYPFVVAPRIAGKPDLLREYLGRAFGDISLVIGVDRGILDAALIARSLNRPFGLISYEIYFADETGMEFKAPEIESCLGLSFAVCQDRVRSSHLARENQIPIDKIIDIPVAGRGVRRGERGYVLHDSLNIDRTRKIAICIGHIDGKWTGIDGILESTALWDKEWVLLLHHRYGTRTQHALINKINALNTGNIFISPFPALPFDQMHRLLHSADLGIAFYVPQRQGGFLENNNLLNLGMASGKISTYLQYGLPVVINEIGELSTHVREKSLGLVAKDFKDIPALINGLTREKLSLCSENCCRFFETRLDLNNTIKPLLNIINGLPEEMSTAGSDRLSRAECDVSIIVATKDRARPLDEMLSSLKQAAGGLKYEVIVIEGNSADDTAEVLHRHGVTRIFNEREALGEGKHTWPELYNFGFSKATGRWGMYASDDIVFESGCLSNAVAALDKQPPEVAGGVFFYKDLYPENPGWGDFGICFTIGQHLLMNYGLVRMDFFRGVQGLDDSYKFYQADADLSLKAAAKGNYFIPLAGSFLVHKHKLESKKQIDAEYGKKDTELLIQKWSGSLPVDIPFPSRLMYDEQSRLAFDLPLHVNCADPAIKDFWHGIAWLHKEQYQKAADKLLRVMASCGHWIVVWYVAQALIGVGRMREAKRGIEFVIKSAPDFAEAKELLAWINAPAEQPESAGEATPAPGAKTGRRLVIHVKYGGLGDHLFYSHLPRIAKQTGAYDEVYVSNMSEFRHPDYKRLIWELNPYVDGFTDEQGFYPEFAQVEQGSNILDKIMLLQGLDDGKRFHDPELYYQPEVIPELREMTVYDPNFISYVGELSAEAIESYFTRNRVDVDCQMKLRDKSLAISHFKQSLESASLEHFCSIIVSCKRLYCLSSGTATLAAALGKPATVFYGKGQMSMFHHSRLHTYISPEDPAILARTESGRRQRQKENSLFILHTVECYPPDTGETGKAVQIISEGLAKRGHYVEIATAKSPDREHFESNGVVIREFEVQGNLVSGIRGNDMRRYQEFLLDSDADVVVNFASRQWATDLAYTLLDATKDRRVNILAPRGYPAPADAQPQFEKYFTQLVPLAVPLYDAAVYTSAMNADYEYAHLHGFQNSVIIPDGIASKELAGKEDLTWEAVIDRYEELYLRLFRAKQEKAKNAAVPPSDRMGDEEAELVAELQRNFRDVPSLIHLAELAMQRSKGKKARNYLIAAMALEPQNMQVKALWAKINEY